MLRVVVLGGSLLLASCLALTRGDLSLGPKDIGVRQIQVTNKRFNSGITPDFTGRRYALNTDSVYRFDVVEAIWRGLE